MTYTSTDRFHALEDVLELELPEAAAVELRLSSRASGSPVLDAATGAVLGVLGTALHTPGRRGRIRGAAASSRTVGAGGAVGRGAGAQRGDGGRVRPRPEPGRSAAADGGDRAARRGACARGQACAPSRSGRGLTPVHGQRCLRGGPRGQAGSGRTTELAALAARRADDVATAPTVWLRGADLRAGDGGVREAVGRARRRPPGRQDCDAAAAGAGAASGGEEGCEGAPSADVVARLARDAKRPLLVLLDAPEEMPAVLRPRVEAVDGGHVNWLRASGARMASRAVSNTGNRQGSSTPPRCSRGAAETGRPEGTTLPPCLWIGDLRAGQATRARREVRPRQGALTEPDAGHPRRCGCWPRSAGH